MSSDREYKSCEKPQHFPECREKKGYTTIWGPPSKTVPLKEESSKTKIGLTLMDKENLVSYRIYFGLLVTLAMELEIGNNCKKPSC